MLVCWNSRCSNSESVKMTDWSIKKLIFSIGQIFWLFHQINFFTSQLFQCKCSIWPWPLTYTVIFCPVIGQNMAVLVRGQGQDQRLEHCKFKVSYFTSLNTHTFQELGQLSRAPSAVTSRVSFTRKISPNIIGKPHCLKGGGGRLTGRMWYYNNCKRNNWLKVIMLFQVITLFLLNVWSRLGFHRHDAEAWARIKNSGSVPRFQFQMYFIKSESWRTVYFCNDNTSWQYLKFCIHWKLRNISLLIQCTKSKMSIYNFYF